MPKDDRPKNTPIKVIWEFMDTPDAEARLAEAFEMLFAEMGKEELEEAKEEKRQQTPALPISRPVSGGKFYLLVDQTGKTRMDETRQQIRVLLCAFGSHTRRERLV